MNKAEKQPLPHLNLSESHTICEHQGGSIIFATWSTFLKKKKITTLEGTREHLPPSTQEEID